MRAFLPAVWHFFKMMIITFLLKSSPTRKENLDFKSAVRRLRMEIGANRIATWKVWSGSIIQCADSRKHVFWRFKWIMCMSVRKQAWPDLHIGFRGTLRPPPKKIDPHLINNQNSLHLKLSYALFQPSYPVLRCEHSYQPYDTFSKWWSLRFY